MTSAARRPARALPLALLLLAGCAPSSKNESPVGMAMAALSPSKFLLVAGEGSEELARAYYARILRGTDPKTFTLDDWKRRTFGAGGATNAFYRNANELGFWRDMTCTQRVARGQGGCAVTNFLDVSDRAAGRPNVGTVAMDIDAAGVTQFYAFGADGALIPRVALDSEGPKNVPNVCVTCHSGSATGIERDGTDLGSIFREFEPSLLDESPGASRDDLETSFFVLNQIATSANRAVRRTDEGGPPNVDHAVSRQLEYLNGLYERSFPPKPVDVRSTAHLPESWQTGSPPLAAAKRELWTQVVNPSCMPCHRANDYDWSDYSAFSTLARRNAQGVARLTRSMSRELAGPGSLMPQAELTAKNLLDNRRAQAAIASWLDKEPACPIGQLACATGCCSPGSAGSPGLPARLVAGGFHTCALTLLGGAVCWGDNSFGQIGNDGTTDAVTPRPVTGLDKGVVALSAGFYHTCAVTSSGGVGCWGSDGQGQLGDGGSARGPSPKPVTALRSGAIALAAGGLHTCALLSSGGVLCWGYNEFGQLGTAGTANASSPTPVAGLATGVTALAAGDAHTCALTSSGSVLCWGHNEFGQLGTAGTANTSSPTPVNGLPSGVTALAAGERHTCALTSSGAVFCWGGNDAGQLGNGSTTNALSPIAVTELSSGVTALAAGGAHTCAGTASRGVLCWGTNGGGLAGAGGATRALLPTPVNGLPREPTTALAAGEGHLCAASAGGVFCWGHNLEGQLGNGSRTNEPTPRSAVDGL